MENWEPLSVALVSLLHPLIAILRRKNRDRFLRRVIREEIREEIGPVISRIERLEKEVFRKVA